MIPKNEEASIEQWKSHWTPGDVLCAEESMTAWAGASEVHISYLPRKPHPLGIQLKTICDARSGIWLDIDPVEGKDIDASKEFFT